MSITSETREDDLQVAERLTTLVVALANVGTADQRRGRDRAGHFVAVPRAIESQTELESALLSVSKRISKREDHS